MFGPGVERSGLKANEPTHFTVDCTEAGEGDVSVGIKCDARVLSEDEEDVDFDIIHNANDTFTVKYVPPAAGRYTIKVLFASQVCGGLGSFWPPGCVFPLLAIGKVSSTLFCSFSLWFIKARKRKKPQN